MVKRNVHLTKLQSGYLFPEINRRKNEFLKKHPSAQLINLGIGDTTQPIPLYISEAMQNFAKQLASEKTYRGYGTEQGSILLREAIAEQYYQGKIDPQEVFVSDGSKCDVGRLQILFGSDATIAVQNPTYPAYVDTGVINGQASFFQTSTKQYQRITYMSCLPENNFFPDLANLPKTDLIYFCSPNNPTGSAATNEQLRELVQFAKKRQSIIIFDAAYASFVRSSHIPRSIYEIEGAKEVAIEVGSFSKMIGFTGVRLGWSVVPKQLRFEDGHSVQQDWERIVCTFFNGASNIAQAGGLAALQKEGLQAIDELSSYYMKNSNILKKAFEECGYKVYGGENVPYLWVHFPQLTSWEAFEILLKQSQLVSVPGSGFGSAGEGFLRFSAFGKQSDITVALPRIKHALLKIKPTVY